MRSVAFVFLLTYFLSVHVTCGSKSSIQWNRTEFPKIVTGVPFKWGLTMQRTRLSAELTGRSCLKNIDECMEEDLNRETASEAFSNLLFNKAPPFDLTKANVSSTCRKQSEKYLEDLKKFKLWALKMYDATAKLPSGLLNGNLNQLGDFDQCLSASEKSHNINGQYCLASIQVEFEGSSPYILALHRLIHSHFHFKSQLDDPGHRVPRFSSINWALCVPSGCSSGDVENGLKEALDQIAEDADLEIQVRVAPEMCQSQHRREIPVSTIIAVCVFGAVILFEVAATIYDCYAVGEKSQWITAFSIWRNFMNGVSLKRASDDIEAIHGIRCLNAILLVIAHKCMAIFFVPYTNRTAMIEFISRPWTVVGRAASLYTDPFIMISGTLTAYALLGKLRKTGKINLLDEYVSRLMRIVPTLAALIAFCTLILPWTGSGPMWNTVVTHHSDICKQYWWRNLLFVHNYFGFKDMCLTHTHHVGIDTQLFFLSPFFVLLLWKWPKRGAWTLVFLAVVSTAMRYYVTYSRQLSNYIHFGTSITQLFQTADNMYILPVHRATVYIMGIFLGYILRNYKNIALTKGQIRFGNALALLSFTASLFGPAFMGTLDYIYNPTDAAWYAAFIPILWCFSFGWVIFTTHVGYKGIVEKFLSWDLFRLWTKFSYAIYLTQFPIFFFNVGVTRAPDHYGFFGTHFNLKEFLWIGLISVPLTLIFEMPFQNIRNLLFKKNKLTKVENVQKKVM